MLLQCSTCKDLKIQLKTVSSTEENLGFAPFIRLTTTYLSLCKSSDSGVCRTCALLFRGIRRHHDQSAGVHQGDIKDYFQSEAGSSHRERVDSLGSRLVTTSTSNIAGYSSCGQKEAFELWSAMITADSSVSFDLAVDGAFRLGPGSGQLSNDGFHMSLDLPDDADKLVVFAHVASIFSSAFDTSGYIAGQWTSNTLGLLWYPNDGKQYHRPTKAGHIPSWSWASVEGSPIHFDNSTWMDLGCTASFTSEDYGELAWLPTGSDRLELDAIMVTSVTFRVEGPAKFSLVKNGVSVNFKPDIIPPHGYDALEFGDTLVCVLVSMTRQSSILGLVLKQLSRRLETYRRVGRFECCVRQVDCVDGKKRGEFADALFGYWFPEDTDLTQIGKWHRYRRLLYVI
jgi:hypothetical protein